MIVEPGLKNFRCTNAHPTGCRQHVQEQVDYVRQHRKLDGGPKNVLVLGASNGLGLASRITAAFGYGASTLGVFFDRPGGPGQTATPGWYNTAAFHDLANEAGLQALSVNGDAYADSVKTLVVGLLKEKFGQVDLVVYSLAAPKRTHPATGHVHRSVLKPIDTPFTELSYNPHTLELKSVTVEPASDEEVADTVAVMGGEDWRMWIETLGDAGLLAPGCKTTAYSYLGPQITSGIYDRGTIGEAKRALDETVDSINQRLKSINGHAAVSVLGAVVTGASAAIPMIPLYLAVLARVMQARGGQDGVIEQIYGLFTSCLFTETVGSTDEKGRYRMDGKELSEATQSEVHRIWSQLEAGDLRKLADIDGYQREFLQLFGFGFDNIDYAVDVETDVAIEGLF